MKPGKQLASEAAWYRAEQARLERELATMTPGHRAAIGQAAYNRMTADVDTFRELAEELAAYVERSYPEHAAGPADNVDGPGLF